MKLERISEIMVALVATFVGLLLAIYLGALIGRGATSTPVMALGVLAVVAVGMVMKQRVWLLLVFCSAIPGRLLFLPLAVTVREAGILLAFAWFVILAATKKLRIKPSYSFLDVVLLINVAYVAIAFIRNPVGTLILETDRIGGRPYFTLGIALGAYFVLTRSVLTGKVAPWLPFVSFAGTTLQTLVGLINFFIPATVPVMAQFYSGLTVATYQGEAAEGDETEALNRMTFFKPFAESGFLLLFSRFRPLTLLNPMYPHRVFLAMVTGFCLLASGFRSALVGVAANFIVASLYYRKVRDALLATIIGGIVLIAVASFQGVLFELPLNIQRSLSFLPGRWDPATVQEAKASKEWRVDMWKTMLTNERYLKNKWFGDGFGYSLNDYNNTVLALRTTKDPEENKESFLILGEVHSGPVSAIRFMGYIGLALYLWLAVLNAVGWHRLIRSARGTPFFTPSLFWGIAPITWPLFFIFIFGAYETALASTIISIGYLHFIRHGLQRYLREQEVVAEEELALPEKIRSGPARLIAPR